MKNCSVSIFIIFLLANVLLFTSCESSAPAGLTDEDKAYFHEMTTNAYESWNKELREPYLDRYSDDAIYMAPNVETIEGIAGIREYVISFPDVKIGFPIVDIWGNSELANIRGTFVINDPDGNLLDKGKYVSVWQKSAAGNWQLTHDIFNSDMPLPAEAGNTADIKANLIKTNDELFHKGNLDYADEVFSSDYAGGGPAFIKEYVGDLRVAFPDLKVEIDPVVAEDNMLGWRRTHTGTHQGAYMDIPPTGKKISWEAIILTQTEDSKIVKEWAVDNLLEVLQQEADNVMSNE